MGEGAASPPWAARLTRTHVEHFSRKPDWVFGVQVVFNARGIDARRYILVRHCDARDSMDRRGSGSSESPRRDATGMREKIRARLYRDQVRPVNSTPGCASLLEQLPIYMGTWTWIAISISPSMNSLIVLEMRDSFTEHPSRSDYKVDSQVN